MKFITNCIVTGVCMVLIAIIVFVPDATFAVSDPNYFSFTASDSNSLTFMTMTWTQPVYECSKHGETTNVMTIYVGPGDPVGVCIKCFLDVFPPLKKVTVNSEQ